jgi:hypothetical protein
VGTGVGVVFSCQGDLTTQDHRRSLRFSQAEGHSTKSTLGRQENLPDGRGFARGISSRRGGRGVEAGVEVRDTQAMRRSFRTRRILPGGFPGLAPWAGMRCPLRAWDRERGLVAQRSEPPTGYDTGNVVRAWNRNREQVGEQETWSEHGIGNVIVPFPLKGHGVRNRHHTRHARQIGRAHPDRSQTQDESDIIQSVPCQTASATHITLLPAISSNPVPCLSMSFHFRPSRHEFLNFISLYLGLTAVLF